ncbi:MAG: ABC transporter permease [Oscillospiraceae bacterium]|nr:ABC transporter permease [Oscillospiraceae bacterium]
MGTNLGKFLFKNNVAILFLLLSVGAFAAANVSLPFLFEELFTRFSRNTFMVLSLLIPVVAGLGLNFAIVIGAIAAQIAIFLTVLWGGAGFVGVLMAVGMAVPMAILFGFLVGKLFNSMKGTEMIGGMVAGFFSDGLYQFLFLFVLGGIIPIANDQLMISTGIGVLNAIVLENSIHHGLDNVAMIHILDFAFFASLALSAIMLIVRGVKKQPLNLKQPAKVVLPLAVLYALGFIPAVGRFLSADRLMLFYAVMIALAIVVLYSLYHIIRRKESEKPTRFILYIVGAAVVFGLTYIPELERSLMVVRLPVLTYIVIISLCLGIKWFMNTKLGQNMRTVGQDRAVAASSGINVNRIRIIAMIMSTSLASIGQIISLQNIGTMATYGSHQQVALFSIAALLVGGASVQRATVKQALLGVFLFHTLFILSANAGQSLLGNAQIGEYFRVFVAYAVIAVALAMHAWVRKSNKQVITQIDPRVAATAASAESK